MRSTRLPLAKLFNAEKYDDVFRIIDLYFLYLSLKFLGKGKTLIQRGAALKQASGMKKDGLKPQFETMVVGKVNPGKQIIPGDFVTFGMQKMDPSSFFQRYPDLPNASKERKIEAVVATRK